VKLKLNTWQRVTLSIAVGQVQGNLQVMYLGNKILKALELTPQEKEEIGLQIDDRGRVFWDDTQRVFTVEVPNECKAIMQQSVRSFQGWTAGRYEEIADIYQQLDMNMEEELNA
jgi:hypothetical protein